MYPILRTFCILLALIGLSACGAQTPICPTEPIEYLTLPPEALATPVPSTAPAEIDLGGKTITAEKVVEGPLCNDSWRGTVYVACNIQVYAWKDSPDFLKNCNLTVAPETVVYVARHNNAAYYNGCSCHTGQINEP